MTERKTMDLEGLPAPALGVEERSDEALSAGAKSGPNPEVSILTLTLVWLLI
jgi:hypothetical protein